MAQSALRPFQIDSPTRSLTERLAAELGEEAKSAPDPTPSSIAERFAPESQRIGGVGPLKTMVDPTILQSRLRSARRAAGTSPWLLAGLALMSVIPAAIILVLLWQGAIRMSGPKHLAAPAESARPAASQKQAAIAPLVPVAVERARVAAPDVVLAVPGEIEAIAGQDIAFDITFDAIEQIPARSVIAIRDMPEGAAFSQGRPYGSTEWNLLPDEIGDLRLHLPEAQPGEADLRIELVAADGKIITSAVTRLAIVQDPRAALIVRADESGRVEDLVMHGDKMIEVGYLAGARAYYRRAAEAGSGDAALATGATFDPEFIDAIGAHGIKASPTEARAWYERASKLGVTEIEAKLATLKDDWARLTMMVAPAPAKPAKAAPVKANAPKRAEAPSEDSSTLGRIVAAASVLTASDSKWVEASSSVNVRADASSSAETLKVVHEGKKFRATGRKGNWVQVTDPATKEVGWIYSSFVEPTDAPSE